ncbi:MAG: protein kinase [Planctomycetes bacterium]|nr:protein kinase [Planctomycetota bacterium]
MADGAEVFDFLDEYLRDRSSGRAHELSHYLKRFPGSEPAIAREFLALQDGVKAEPSTTPRYAEDRRVGAYRLVREIGRGGQGAVWLAEDTRIARRVALKLLPPSFAALSADRRERLRREAEIVAKLAHPAIATIYEAQIDGDTPFIAMRFVEGESVASTIERAKRGERDELLPLPPRNALELARVLAFFERAARALHAAHEAGVVHRDVKPGNLMLDRAGEPVVLDFGQAREEASTEIPLTISGDVFGTPSFMSPEQARGETKSLDRKSDVWSLGASLYECLTLERPFQGASYAVLLDAIQRSPLPDPRAKNASLSNELAVVLETALEKDRERRYPSALEFAEDLRRLREYEPIRARPASAALVFRRWMQRRPALAAVTLGLIATLAIGLAWTLYLLSREEHALRYATGRYLAERAIDLIAEDPSAAVVVGIDAVERAPTYQTRAALFAALDACRLEHPLVAGEGRRIMDVDPSPDGKLALTALDHGTAKAWDLESGRELFETEASPSPLRAARFLGSTGLFATVCGDTLVRFWRVDDGRADGSIDANAELATLVSTADGARFVTLAAKDGTVAWWSTSERRVLASAVASLAGPLRLALARDGATAAVWNDSVATESSAFALVVFDEHGARSIRCAAANVRDVAFDARGERVIAASSDGRASVWSARDGALLDGPFELAAPLTSAAFSPDGTTLAFGADVGGAARAFLWDLAQHRATPLIGDVRARVLDVEFSPDGTKLATACHGNSVGLWDVASAAPLATCLGYLQPVRVTWTHDGTRVLALNLAHTANAWFGDHRPDLYELRGHRGPLTGARFDASGTHALTTSEDGTARLWSTPPEPSLVDAGRELAVLAHTRGAVRGGEFATDGQRVLTFGDDGTARIWRVLDGVELVRPIVCDDALVRAGFDASAERLFALTAGGRAFVADARASGAQRELARGDVRAASFTRDGRFVVTGHGDGSVIEWDASDGTLRLEHHIVDTGGRPTEVTALAVARSRDLIAIACGDSRARFFAPERETEAHEPVWFFRMSTLDFGRDDTRLLATGPEGRGAMKLFDLEHDVGLLPEVYHSADLEGGVFAKRGRFFVTFSEDGTAYVRDALDGRPFIHLELHRGAIVSAEFSPDEPLRLLTASSDGTARISPVDPLPAARARMPRELYEWELAREQRLAEPLSFR